MSDNVEVERQKEVDMLTKLLTAARFESPI
jgi:hypothetical protein